MKNTSTFFTLFLFGLVMAQSKYEKISDGAVNRIFKHNTEEFSKEFFEKCFNNELSTGFKSIPLSVPMERYWNKNSQKICQEINTKFGKIEIKKFNNAYYHKFLIDDQVQMYVYDIKSEQSKEARYFSIWVGSVSKKIQGFWITRNKPFEEDLIIHY